MDMMKQVKRITVLLLTLLMVGSILVLPAGAVGTEHYYTYNFDWNYNALPSPDAYAVRYTISANELGVNNFKNALGMFVQGDDLYVVDTGNNRLLQIRLTEKEPQLIREITGTEEWTLSAPEDVFVTEDGTMYVTDTGNRRILIVDSQLNLLQTISQPQGSIYDATVEFKPSKLVVADSGRIYVQANGVNRGLMEFDEQGNFAAYLGASNVRFDWTDYIWKLLSTDAQKSQMEAFVPTEYNNVALDSMGMLFVTTATFEVSDLLTGVAEPVRRLNQKGKNTLVQEWLVIGDYTWDKTGPSRFVDITVLDNGIYYVLDSTRNRIFAYDSQGIPLYTFGGYGTRQGYFQTPKALEHWGDDLLILDSTSGMVTVMRQTEYGATVQEAIESYNTGGYDRSFQCWEQVLQMNGHYRLAYDNIGKILLRNGDYEQALDYLEYAKDSYYYSKAWSLHRKDMIEQYLIYFILALIAFVVILYVVKIIRKEREALEVYEDRKAQIRDRSASE